MTTVSKPEPLTTQEMYATLGNDKLVLVTWLKQREATWQAYCHELESKLFSATERESDTPALSDNGESGYMVSVRGGHAPTKTHANIGLARAEAKRLAERHLMTRVTVLQIIESWDGTVRVEQADAMLAARKGGQS